MNLHMCKGLRLAGAAVACLLAPGLASGKERITLDGASAARVFEGIGVLSAGASSRLLIDYPEPQRSEILDYLFKPNFGAAIQHLKVEIGGDINSTCGTEPSIARSREEFTNPRPEYFQRGYEWWLMKEAKKRNPAIIFDVLQWGAPGWVGNGNFYSQDNADLIVAFIKGAKKHHDLDISYCGIWNERPYEVEWIKLLRRTLNAAGLPHVKIVAADETVDAHWAIVDKMANDRELRDAIDVIGTHYVNFTSPKEAHQFGKPVWDSEDGPWNGEWCRPSLYAGPLQQMYNRNYVTGAMTKTIIWSPVSSYYPIFPLPNSGLMRANQPWSGNYFVEPGIWITAHTTQFIQPGWKYLGAEGCRLLAGGGSCVGAVSPDGKDFSLMIETLGAKRSQQLVFSLEGGLSASALSVWRSTQGELFARQADASVQDGAFTFLAEPEALYSLTTTAGQGKGDTVIPSAAPLSLPYQEDFSAYPAGRTPRYLSDFYGVFETAVAPDGRKCLQQMTREAGIQWNKGAVQPLTIIGDPSWIDYEISCEVWLDAEQHAAIYAALGEIKESKTPLPGYVFKLEADGKWQLGFHDPQYQELVSGKVGLKTGHWVRLALQVGREEIVVLIDGSPVGRVADRRFRSGFVGIGCGYEPVRFSGLSVRGIFETLAPRHRFTTAEIHKGTPETDLRLLNSYGDAPANVQEFFSKARALLGKDTRTGAGFAGNEALTAAARHHGLTHLGGPLLGAVSDRGVAIWLRTIEPATVTVRASGPDAKEVSAEARSSLESQLTAVVELSRLEPGTRYTYKILIDGKPVPLAYEASFTTAPAPDARTRVRLAFGADFHKAGLHNPWLLGQVRARGALAMLLIGDLAVDDRRDHFGLIRSDYLLRDLSPAWQRFAATVPVYAAWDDHDYYGNDCSGIPEGCTEEEQRQLVRCWRESWNNPAYGAGQEGIYFRTRIGPADVIVLDTRSCRTRESFLGDGQMRWLKEQLRDCKGPFVVISSGTMWSDYISGGKDSWGVFGQAEREQIFSFIEENKIPGVLLISGDRHGARGFTIPRPGGHALYEFGVGSLGGIVGPPPLIARHKAERALQLFGHDGIAFGEFEFDTTSESPTVTFRLISEAGNILETVKVETHEFTNP